MTTCVSAFPVHVVLAVTATFDTVRVRVRAQRCIGADFNVSDLSAEHQNSYTQNA